LGKPPKMLRDVKRVVNESSSFIGDSIDLQDAVIKVLSHPTVASKRFLITIGDRTVGGLTHRDQMVGPWQIPVADVAVTLADYRGFAGEAMAMGERTPLAAIHAPASGRMAVAECLTNLMAAPIELGRVKLSANWMAACGEAGEDAALYETVKAVGLELCPALGISIPVGKDSLSMRTQWTDQGQRREVISPVSLIVSGFASLADVRGTWTPQLDAQELDTIDEDQVWEALQAAQLADIVADLPMGLYTPIGDNGIRLSGGQRQRLALARAFYRNARFLVLDEATSALDNRTEAEVMDAIEVIGRRCTLVVIAHRLSTVIRSDCIFEFEAGRIKASGTFEQLRQRSETFQDLASFEKRALRG